MAPTPGFLEIFSLRSSLSAHQSTPICRQLLNATRSPERVKSDSENIRARDPTHARYIQKPDEDTRKKRKRKPSNAPARELLPPNWRVARKGRPGEERTNRNARTRVLRAKPTMSGHYRRAVLTALPGRAELHKDTCACIMHKEKLTKNYARAWPFQGDLLSSLPPRGPKATRTFPTRYVPTSSLRAR